MEPSATVKRVGGSSGPAKYDISGVSSSRNALDTGHERFEVDLDEDDSAADPSLSSSTGRRATTALKPLVKDILEHDSDDDIPAPPSSSRQGKMMSSFPVPPKLSFSRPLSSNGPPAQRQPTGSIATDSAKDKGKERQEIDKLLDDVSQENERVLGQMSEQDILAEQESISQLGLSESVLAMLKNRAAAKAKASRPIPTKAVPPDRHQQPQSDSHAAHHHHHHHHHHEAQQGPTFDMNGVPDGDGQGHSLESLLAFTASSLSSQRSTGYLVLSRVFARPRPDSVANKTWLKSRLDVTRSALRALSDPSASVVARAIDLLVYTATEEHQVLSEPASVKSLARALLRRDLDIAGLLPVVQSLPLKTETFSNELLAAFVSKFVNVKWPQQSYPRAIAWLDSFAKSSRQNAKTVSQPDLLEATTRFLSLPYWKSGDAKRIKPSYDAALELYSTLATYGLGTAMRTTCASLLNELERHAPNYEPGQEHTITTWLKLLSLWTTAAIDPHLTDHQLTWTKVVDWFETGQRVYERAKTFDSLETYAVLAGVCSYFAAFVEGARINQPNKGQDALSAVSHIIREDMTGPNGRLFRSIEESLRFDLFDLPQAAAHLANTLVLRPAEDLRWPIVDWLERACASQKQDRNRERLVVELGLLIPDGVKRFDLACQTVSILRTGEEVATRKLTDALLAHCALAEDDEVMQRAALLRPFVLHAIVQSSKGRVVNPVHATVRDLRTVDYVLDSELSRKPVLRPFWAMSSVLDELLRSGEPTSVFKTGLPDDWDASELQLVQSALAVTVELVSRGHTDLLSGEADLGATLAYECMKVFMLEKDSPSTKAAGAETEIFRDDAVQRSLSTLLRPLRLGSSTIHRISTEPISTSSTSVSGALERVSSTVSSAPFYQLYADFVGLYDSISFGDPLFASLVLLPLSQDYPIDYRRLLWTDYAHALKSVRVPLRDMLVLRGADGLSHYLHPFEKDQTMLEAYARAMVSNRISKADNEALYFLACHHVASYLWSRSDTEGETDREDETRRRLSRVLRSAQGHQAVEDVLSYTQNYAADQSIVIPPACWAGSSDGGVAAVTRRQKLEQWSSDILQ